MSELGLDTEGMVESTAKLREEIMALTGVDIMEANGKTFKSTFAIMQELANKWQDLSDIQQATVTELIAGKRQGNIVSSLMENFDLAEQALETSLNSAGSAMKEHSKWQQSLEAQILKLKASWQGLSQAFLSSDFLKFALNGVTLLVDGLTELVDTIGALPTLIGLGAAGKGLFSFLTKDKKTIADVVRKIEHLTDVMGTNTEATDEATMANMRNAASEKEEAIATAASAAAEQKETAANVAGATTETADATASSASTVAEQSEATATTASTAAQVAETAADTAGAIAEAADTSASLANAAAEQKETVATTASTAAQVAETAADTAGAIADVADSATGTVASLGSSLIGLGKSAGKAAAGGVKALVGKLATFATTHPIITATIAVVAALGAAIWYEKKKAEELSEKVDEVTSSYKEQSTELAKLKGNYDASNENSMISKYERLSKGVNSLGENVSLTADEYSEYQNIVNTIAEQIPSLVTGYDAQGNAMLECAGDADKLAESYKNLVREQNNELLENGSDIFKDFSNDLKDTSAYYQTSTTDKYGNITYQDNFDADYLDTIEKLMNMSDAELENAISELSYHEIQQISDAFEQYGHERNKFGSGDPGWENTSQHILRVLQKDKADIKRVLDESSKDINAYAENLGLVTDAYFSNAFLDDYSHMSGRMQSIITQIASGFDTDFYADFLKEDNPYEALTGYLDNLLETFDNLSDVDTSKLESAFDLQAKFNGGEISYGEYIKNLKEVNELINSLDVSDDIKADLKLGLNTDGAVEEYEALVERLTSKEIGLDDKAARNFLNSLSAEEFDVAMDIIPKLDAGTTVSEIRKLIDEKLADEFKFDIELQIAGIEAFNTALSEARSATGLTSESIAALKGRYEDLEGFNAGALFENTANGVHVNNEELARLEAQYESINKLDIKKNLNTLASKYKELTEKIKTCTDAQEKETLQAQANAYADKIHDLQLLESQYEGLTSALSKWQQALSSPNDGDNYVSIFENLENIQELYKQGLVGTDDFKTFAQLMSFEDLSTASIDEQVSAYKKGLPVIKRYFTEGQKGCQNFLNDLNKINSEWAHKNENGDWEINIDVEKAAKELDLNVSTIYSILDRLKDYGFEINIDDSSLGDIQTDIEKTEAKLKELGRTPQSINLDASNIETIDGEISKLKTHISEVKNDNSLSVEVKTAELDDARTKLEALIQKKQEASQPAFMNLDTSQVKSSMTEALGYVQDYQNAIDNMNMLLELQEYGIEVDDSELDTAKQKVDEYAKLIQGLPDEVKLAIGLKEDASIDDIKAAFANGDIVIDADTSTTNIKIEKLAENIDRIEDKDVTITVTINGLEDVKELNRQIDLATNIEGDIDNLSEYVENAKALSDLDDNITSYVTANIAGNVKDIPEFSLNNLEVFAEGAKALKGVGTFSSKVTADVEGNVIDTPEGFINNLKVFSDSAKDVGSIGEDVRAKVTAEIDGNVTGLFEEQIDNLKVYSESAKEVESIGEVTSSVTADVNGNVKTLLEEQIDNLKTYSNSAKEVESIGKVTSSVNADVKGNVIELFEEQIDNLKVYSDSAKKVEDIGKVKSSVTVDVNGNITGLFEEQIDNLKTYSDNAKDVSNIGDVKSSVTANVKGNVKDLFEEQIDNLKIYSDSAKEVENIGDVESKTTVDVKGNVVNLFEEQIDNLKTYSDSAKKVESIGDVSSSVRADVNGNVTGLFEEQIDNLKVYSDNAKDVSNIGDVSSSVTVNAYGNVVNSFEEQLDNIGVYVENANGLDSIGDVSSSVTANVYGNVTGKLEEQIDNLKVYADSAKDVGSIGNVSSEVTADVYGNVVGKLEEQIDNLGVYSKNAKTLSGLGNISSSVTANINGNVTGKLEEQIDNLEVFAAGANKLKNTGSFTSSVTANINGNVINTTEEKIDNLGVFATNANKLKNTGNFSSSVSANVNGNVVTDDSVVTDLEHFASVVSGLPSQAVTVSVTANVDSTNINSAIDLLTKAANSGVFKDYKATVQVGAKISTIDAAALVNYKPPKKEGTVAYKVDSSKVDSWKAPTKSGVVNYSAEVEALTSAQKHKTGTITYKANIVGLGPAAGTAHVSGSANASGSTGRAFARGDWGIKGNGVALGGELGREVVVRDGKFFTIGDEGAQFFRYKKNDIVFNAAQTEALFKYGGLKGANPRGKMLASGTAFAEGNAFATATASGGGKFYNSSTGQSYGSKSSDSDSSSDKDFEEVIDWIEVILDRVERSIDKFDQQANNIYKSWSSRNSSLQSEISEVSREINLQQQAYSRYMSAANGVGLSSSWQNKVKNGTIDISTIKDEALADKIKSYEEWYNKALDCKDAILELQETESALFAQRFENIQTQYDGILQGYEHTETMLNEYISQAEEQGFIVSKKYYEALITNEKQNINALKQEQAELIKARDEAVASGKITKQSEEWYNMCNEIDSVTQAIEEGSTALLEYARAMEEIDWSVFDLIQERISGVTEEADFLIELMSNKDLFDDNGKLTSQGLATMGLHAQNYNSYMYQSDEYGAEVAKLDAQIKSDPYDQELIKRRNELLELQRESILAAEQEKENIKSLIEDAYSKELDSLDERIQKYEESLDAQKDLLDYQRKVEKSVKNISSLRKQLSAYEGFDDEETKATVQRLKLELEEAESELQETEYDKLIQDSEILLSSLYEEYELLLNQRLDNTDALLSQAIENANANATAIQETLTSETDKVGITLSNAMSSIWSGADGNAKSVLTMYGEDFKSKSATIITTLNGIKSSVNSMVTSLNKEATTKTTANKTTTSAKKNPTTSSSTTTSKTTTTTSKASSGDGKPKIGDRVKYVSGQYYYDSQGSKPLGSHNKGEYVYITNINTRDWATHQYHISTGNKLGKGDLGWLKLNQLSGYASGKKDFLKDEVAWTQEGGLEEYIVRPSDGAILTPIAKKGSVLNAQASDNLWNMTNSPAEFIKENLGIGGANVPNTQNVNNTYTQHIDNVVFDFKNVKNYDQMLEQMQRDKSFEKLILSMTIDQIAGRSKLAKGKSIR